jgi:hypothetical protein
MASRSPRRTAYAVSLYAFARVRAGREPSLSHPGPRAPAVRPHGHAAAAGRAHRDGHELSIELTLTATDTPGAGVHAFAHDVTAAVRREVHRGEGRRLQRAGRGKLQRCRRRAGGEGARCEDGRPSCGWPTPIGNY